jgi:hypothetical protein
LSCEGQPHTGIISPTSVSHVGYGSTTSVIHVEYQQPTAASHAGGTSLVITSHIALTSPTYASHVGVSSQTYAIHVGDFLIASASHAGSMSPATASHVGGIHMIDKPRCVRHNPNILCILYKGDHITHLCPATVVVQEAWSFPGGPSGSESSFCSQYSLVDTIVMSMKSLADTPLPLGDDASLDLVVLHPVQPVVVLMQYLIETTPMFWGDASLDLIDSHHVQPMVEEVVMLMQYLVDPTLLLKSDKPKEVTSSMQSSINPTLLLEGDASFNHFLSISSYVPYSLGIIPLSSTMLPPSLRVVYFDWNDLVEPRLHSSTPFHIRGIIQCIIDKVTSTSILSSSTWKYLGFPNIVSTLHKLLTFHSDPGGYRWPPTFSDWLKTVFWQFWQFTIFSRF